jgi:iron complex outermembrane recepter protein
VCNDADVACLKIATALALILAPAVSWAQRTDENAITAAEDAFGITVGRESIGIYDDGNVRGFSPSAAGNFRIEGLYFDSQGGITGRINDEKAIHVGPSAQGFPFPAPTGIVDLNLRGSGQKSLISSLISTNSFGSFGAELDTQLPLIGSLSASAGFGYFRNRYGNGGGSTRWNVGIVPHWQLSENIDLKAFYSREQTYRDTAQVVYIPDGDFFPGRIERVRYPGPDYTLNDYYTQAFGLLGRANFGSWTVKGGIFRSMNIGDVSYSNTISVARDAQTTQRFVNAFPPNAYASWSGEVRISREFSEGPRKHMLTASLRGRSLVSRYGDSISTDIGLANLNDFVQARRPTYTFGPLTSDKTEQLTGGVAYNLAWKGIGELTISLQRTRYVKRVLVPDAALARGSTEAWLPSFSATLPLSNRFALYGSYVRGVEDSGTAPGFTANANTVLPANRTRQFDLGLKVVLPRQTTIIFGYYDIEKPYIDINTSNFFGILGAERHQGIELSITSNPVQGLTIVGGGIFSRPRVAASSEIAEPVGPRPVGEPDVSAQINLNYQLPFASMITLDAYINYDSSVAAKVSNSIIIPESIRFGGGVRYNFTFNAKPFTLRISASNLGNVYRLTPVGSGVYTYRDSTSVSAYITADF